MIQQLFLWVLLLVTLTGCESLQHEPLAPIEWQSHQDQLRLIDNYQISGKLGYISTKERRSFNFYWIKTEKNSQLRLSTFLGQTVLKINITDDHASVETYDDQKYTAKTPEALLSRMTGLNIPLGSLAEWILGLPTMANHYTLNQSHTLQSLEKKLGEQVWQVTYDNYTAVNFHQHQLPLPTKLSLKQNHTKINLSISEWKLNQ